MNASQNYLVAKYTPDVRRMELRNIGVILAAGGVVVSRFLTEDDASFVNDLRAYQRWVAYWNSVISGERSIPVSGPKVDKTDPRFLAELRKTQNGNYRLFEAGSVLDHIDAENVDAAADFLFKELVTVEKKSATEPADPLKVVSNEIMDAIGLSGEEGYETPYKADCQIGLVKKRLVFDYAVKRRNKVRSVFQRVRVGGQQSVCGSAFMFDSLMES